MEMETTELAGAVTCVRLSGRLDAPGADRIGVRFTAAVVSQARPAVVDLAGVGFVASMGLRLLIATAKGLQTKGAKMALFGAQPLVQEVLEDAAIGQLIDIAPNEQDAVAVVTA